MSLNEYAQQHELSAITYPMAELNNRKLTLSFKPATAADEATLRSLLPEGEITDLSQLPESIPAYLIKVIPELALDGTVVKQGGPTSLGNKMRFSYTLNLVNHAPIARPSNVIVGSFLNVAVVGGSVSPVRLQQLQATLQQTQATLQSNDTALIGALSREDLLGDIFYAGMLGYYGQVIAFSALTAQQQGGHHSLAAGAGTFGYVPQVDTLLGFPAALRAGGAVIDVSMVHYLGTASGDAVQRKNLNLQLGILASALEHAVPEQMFVTPEAPGEAISAVKALAKANALGQRIYHLTPANQAQTLHNIHHDAATMRAISTALAVGKEVITHTDAVSVPGWSGAGYIIFDPLTGDGAYMITGGANGGLIDIQDNLTSILAWISSLSESILDQFGGLISQAISGIKNLYDTTILFFKLITKCPTIIAIAGIVSFSFLVAGFFTATVAAAALNPIYGLVIATGGSVLAGTLGNSFLKACRK